MIRLRPGRRGALAPEREAAERLPHELLARVARELALEASACDLHVFPNLGYFVLAAPARLVERMLAQPEVASASANRPKA